MVTSTTNPSDQSMLPAKVAWEAPAITVERELEVRAQGGPSGGNGSLPGAIGPFGLSQEGCPPDT